MYISIRSNICAYIHAQTGRLTIMHFLLLTIISRVSEIISLGSPMVGGPLPLPQPAIRLHVHHL